MAGILINQLNPWLLKLRSAFPANLHYSSGQGESTLDLWLPDRLILLQPGSVYIDVKCNLRTQQRVPAVHVLGGFLGRGNTCNLPQSQVNLWHVHENITQDKGMQLPLLRLLLLHLANFMAREHRKLKGNQ